MSYQPSLLDAPGRPTPDASFGRLTRVELDETAWVDHAPGWVTGSDAVFEDLVANARWDQRTVKMYGGDVIQPRLSGRWKQAAKLEVAGPAIREMAELLSDRYGVTFDSIGLNYYRDGSDSVAWHGDRIPKQVVDPTVALVSLGQPRKFLLRPRGGGRSQSWMLGHGDLLVTGGSCQRTWQHSVPKVKQAGPRISIAFRHDMSRKGKYGGYF